MQFLAWNKEATGVLINNVAKMSSNDKETIYLLISIILISAIIALKVQSCKLHSKKCIIASTQIRNTDIFAFIAVLVFKLLSPKLLFINRKDSKSC